MFFHTRDEQFKTTSDGIIAIFTCPKMAYVIKRLTVCYSKSLLVDSFKST
jgi:hypothetical protein